MVPQGHDRLSLLAFAFPVDGAEATGIGTGGALAESADMRGAVAKLVRALLFNSEQEGSTMDAPEKNGSAILWGAKRISAVIGLSERATFHLLEGGQLPAKKVGNRWAADRAQLLAFFRTNGPAS
jgi:hypothetical protein